MNNIVTSGKSLIDDRLSKFDRNVLAPKYLTINDFDEALRNIEITGVTQITLPSFSKYSTEKPADSEINCNNQRIVNLSTLDLTSLDTILATPNSACNVSTTGSLISFQLLLNTAYCGPLFSTMNVKGKTITNCNGIQYTQEVSGDQLKHVPNYGDLRGLTVCKYEFDNYTDFIANARIRGVETTAMTNLQLQNFDSGQLTDQVLDLSKQAVNVQYCLEQCLHANQRDISDTSPNTLSVAFDAQDYNIQNGKRAILPKDFVIKEQVITKEENKVAFTLEEVKISQDYDNVRFEDSDTIYTCSDPKQSLSNNLTIQNNNPGPKITIPKNRQLANLKYVDEKVQEEVKNTHKKTEDIDLNNMFRVKNLLPPQSSTDAVTRSYCDANSKNTDGSGFITSIFGGLLGGLAGSISTSVLSVAGNGLSVFGNITGSLAGGSAQLASGLLSGSAADFLQTVTPENQPLINNLADDIANGGQGLDNQQAQGGGQFQGPFQVSGLLSAVRNAQVGLFDLLQV